MPTPKDWLHDNARLLSLPPEWGGNRSELDELSLDDLLEASRLLGEALEDER